MKFRCYSAIPAKAKEQQVFSFEEDRVNHTVGTKEPTLEFDQNQSGNPKWLMRRLLVKSS